MRSQIAIISVVHVTVSHFFTLRYVMCDNVGCRYIKIIITLCWMFFFFFTVEKKSCVAPLW